MRYTPMPPPALAHLAEMLPRHSYCRMENWHFAPVFSGANRVPIPKKIASNSVFIPFFTIYGQVKAKNN